MNDSTSIEGTILKYENFINDVLKEDLRRIQLRLQQINIEIEDLIQQKHTLKIVTDEETHPSGFKTQLNIGCNFFMEASVKDTSKVLIDIGLNHFMEFTVPEALKYMDARIKGFEIKAEELRDKSSVTKAHIKLMLFMIDELQNSKTGNSKFAEKL